MTGPWGDEEEDSDVGTIKVVLQMLNAQAALLVSVGTGGPKIDSINHTYVIQRRKLNAALKARGIDPPFPYDDLWAWYGHYSQHIPGYAGRRQHIAAQSAPAREALELALEGVQVSDPGSAGNPTWAALDTRVEGVVSELRGASTLDDLQDVGRRCRKILIDAARLLADPKLLPADQEPPRVGDAKAWLELFLAARASGRSHRELRAFIPVAWDLAQKVTHGDVERVDAYAAARATVLVKRSLQQLADIK